MCRIDEPNRKAKQREIDRQRRTDRRFEQEMKRRVKSQERKKR